MHHPEQSLCQFIDSVRPMHLQWMRLFLWSVWRTMRSRILDQDSSSHFVPIKTLWVKFRWNLFISFIHSSALYFTFLKGTYIAHSPPTFLHSNNPVSLLCWERLTAPKSAGRSPVRCLESPSTGFHSYFTQFIWPAILPFLSICKVLSYGFQGL